MHVYMKFLIIKITSGKMYYCFLIPTKSESEGS